MRFLISLAAALLFAAYAAANPDFDKIKPPRGYKSETLTKGDCSKYVLKRFHFSMNVSMHLRAYFLALSSLSIRSDNQVQPGLVVSVAYTARISPQSSAGERGLVFDSTKADKPLRFLAGSNEIIPGWSYGVVGACKGERRRLTIPPEWAFGSEGLNNVPGGATVEITMDVTAVEKPPNLFAEIDSNKDQRLTKAELRAWLTGKGVPADELDAVVEQLLEQDDKNKDGVISWAEYTGPK
jgi:hypothetical protein